MHALDVDLPGIVRDKRHEGDIVLRFVVTAGGRAIQVSVAQPFGYRVDEQYVKAVEGWEFNPAISADGKPLAVHLHITAHLNFQYGPPPGSPAALAAEHPGNDPYSLPVVRDLLSRLLTGSNSSFDAKLVSGLGDKCAIAILKVVARRDLAEPNTARIISDLIRAAFSYPEDIGILSDQQPRVSVFLLNYLHERVADVAAQEHIQMTIDFLTEQRVPTSAVPVPSTQ